jgi:hypothetical protein
MCQRATIIQRNQATPIKIHTTKQKTTSTQTGKKEIITKIEVKKHGRQEILEIAHPSKQQKEDGNQKKITIPNKNIYVVIDFVCLFLQNYQKFYP